MFSPLLLFMLPLLSSTDGGSPPAPPVMRHVSRGDTPALSPPLFPRTVFVDSRLRDPDQVSPSTGGAGEGQLPKPAQGGPVPVRNDTRLPKGSDVHVRTSCKFNKMLVQVHRSILGSGDPESRLTLGTCRASRSTGDSLYFEYDLGMCGAKRAMINNHMAFSNVLRYDPLSLKGPIRRAAPFTISVACYFNRYQYSNHAPNMPLPNIVASKRSKAQFLLTPRNAQWEMMSPPARYILGRSMYFMAEAPAIPKDKRLYVHSCYATHEKSHNSTPQFPVMQNFGCLVESHGSRSRFIQYKINAVRFSVDSSLFTEMTSQQLYMHCSISVGSSVPTPTSKACNYDRKIESWVELYGPDLVCTCCASKCSSAAPTVTKIISSQSWIIDPKRKRSPFSRRRMVSAGPPPKKPSQPDAMGVTPTGFDPTHSGSVGSGLCLEAWLNPPGDVISAFMCTAVYDGSNMGWSSLTTVSASCPTEPQRSVSAIQCAGSQPVETVFFHILTLFL